MDERQLPIMLRARRRARTPRVCVSYDESQGLNVIAKGPGVKVIAVSLPSVRAEMKTTGATSED